MNCPECNSEIPDNSQFCLSCGHRLDAVSGLPDGLDVMVTTYQLVPGNTIAGRYEIKEVVGRGGMGIVYRALDKELDVEVALKVLPPELSQDKRAIRDLKEEAKAGIRLSHPNIVRLHTFQTYEGLSFLVMEYVNGPDLSRVLEEKGSFTVEETLQVGREVCAGLGYAHKSGIVHRDIKPQNLMRSEDGVIKIADFGIARVIADTMSRVSQRPTTGTLVYMSPEQLRGKKVDERSDIYSLGCCLYEFLSGKPPFWTGDIYHQHLEEEPEKLEGIPENINSLVLACLAKAPERRFQRAEDLNKAIDNVESGERISRVTLTPMPTTGTSAKSPEEITNSLGMKLVLIPAGEFIMGSPSSKRRRSNPECPQHKVKITKPFYLGVYQVTQSQYEAVMGENPSYFEGADNPVEKVSWNDAMKFCKRLSEKEGVTYRLPTEAEWEYACRAGSTTAYCFGDEEGLLEEYAWYKNNSASETGQVGMKNRNAWALYDMHGNVWEWCSDRYGEGYYNKSPVNCPKGPSSGECRVLRGGSWDSGAYNCRSANRIRFNPSLTGIRSGLRCVRSGAQ